MANAVMDADENMMEYQHLIKDPKYKQTWLNSCSNELGRLMQGRESTQLSGANTMTIVNFNNIPKDRRKDITYGQMSRYIMGKFILKLQRVCMVYHRPSYQQTNNQLKTLYPLGTNHADSRQVYGNMNGGQLHSRSLQMILALNMWVKNMSNT